MSLIWSLIIYYIWKAKNCEEVDRKQKIIVEIEQLEVIQVYNNNMGVIYKHDQLVSYY